MANNIANVSIPAPVIQEKNISYLEDGQYSPKTRNIPCGVNAWVDDIQHWAVPITDYGICTNLFFQPAVGDYPPGTPPTPDSLLVLRIRDKYKPNFTWWVICTIEQYYASCQTCCADDFIPIPDPTLPIIIPCQSVCESQNISNQYISVNGIPELGAGQEYVGYARVNGEELTDASGATATLLLTDINSKWGTISSPSESIVWTKSSDNLTLIGTGFSEGDVVCVLIEAITPSP